MGKRLMTGPTLTALRLIRMAAPLLYMERQVEAAEHLQRAIDALCAANPADDRATPDTAGGQEAA